MNFWTFIDRNSEGCFWLVFIIIGAACVAVPLTVHEIRTPRPCVCAPVEP